MKEKLIGKLTTIILAAIMAFNAIILARIWLTMDIDSFYREKKTEYTLPEGFTPANTKISWDESFPAPSGWVVRYASSGCIYCRLDFDWERLIPLLERLNYRVILLLPEEERAFEEEQLMPETAQQAAFVKMDWVKQFRFTVTPTLVIFDNNGRVIWHHEGMLNDEDYESAEKAISRNIKGSV